MRGVVNAQLQTALQVSQDVCACSAHTVLPLPCVSSLPKRQRARGTDHGIPPPNTQKLEHRTLEHAATQARNPPSSSMPPCSPKLTGSLRIANHLFQHLLQLGPLALQARRGGAGARVRALRMLWPSRRACPAFATESPLALRCRTQARARSSQIMS